VTTSIRATNIQVMTSITLSLPKWQGYESASTAEKAKWDKYITSLKEHENGHVRIGKEGAATVKKAVEGAKATGMGADIKSSLKAATSNLTKEIDRRIKSASREVQKLHDKFN